jgi:hypothetical protein
MVFPTGPTAAGGEAPNGLASPPDEFDQSSKRYTSIEYGAISERMTPGADGRPGEPGRLRVPEG